MCVYGRKFRKHSKILRMNKNTSLPTHTPSGKHWKNPVVLLLPTHKYVMSWTIRLTSSIF